MANTVQLYAPAPGSGRWTATTLQLQLPLPRVTNICREVSLRPVPRITNTCVKCRRVSWCHQQPLTPNSSLSRRNNKHVCNCEMDVCLRLQHTTSTKNGTKNKYLYDTWFSFLFFSRHALEVDCALHGNNHAIAGTAIRAA